MTKSWIVPIRHSHNLYMNIVWKQVFTCCLHDVVIFVIKCGYKGKKKYNFAFLQIFHTSIWDVLLHSHILIPNSYIGLIKINIHSLFVYINSWLQTGAKLDILSMNDFFDVNIHNDYISLLLEMRHHLYGNDNVLNILS